MDPDVTLSDLS